MKRILVTIVVVIAAVAGVIFLSTDEVEIPNNQQIPKKSA